MPNPIRRREFLGGLAATGLAADLLAQSNATPDLLLVNGDRKSTRLNSSH